MSRSSEEVWSRMVEQAAEDVAWRHAIDEVAALSDEQLDAELRGVELDPKELEREALALFVREKPAEAGEAGQANEAGKPLGQSVFQPPQRLATRRRPVAVAVWLAAAAVTTTAVGGLLYTLLHHPSEQPAPQPSAPPPPEPAPSTPPVESSLPIATMTPAQLRAKAKAALDDGRPDDCLKLLDDAKRTDPAGDATPQIKALRDRAMRALDPKPPAH